jgi:hypothetical protein
MVPQTWTRSFKYGTSIRCTDADDLPVLEDFLPPSLAQLWDKFRYLSFCLPLLFLL